MFFNIHRTQYKLYHLIIIKAHTIYVDTYVYTDHGCCIHCCCFFFTFRERNKNLPNDHVFKNKMFSWKTLYVCICIVISQTSISRNIEKYIYNFWMLCFSGCIMQKRKRGTRGMFWSPLDRVFQMSKNVCTYFTFCFCMNYVLEDCMKDCTAIEINDTYFINI